MSAISVEDMALLNQRTLNGIINHQELAHDMDAYEIAEHNNGLLERRMRNYMYDNPQLFVEHFRTNAWTDCD